MLRNKAGHRNGIERRIQQLQEGSLSALVGEIESIKRDAHRARNRPASSESVLKFVDSLTNDGNAYTRTESRK